MAPTLGIISSAGSKWRLQYATRSCVDEVCCAILFGGVGGEVPAHEVAEAFIAQHTETDLVELGSQCASAALRACGQSELWSAKEKTTASVRCLFMPDLRSGH